MLSAAEQLSQSGFKKAVDSVHLLGAAIPLGRDTSKAMPAIHRKLYNYFSVNDPVLGRAFRTAQLGQQAVGQVGFGSVEKRVVDVDVSREVRGHGEYFGRVHLL